MQDLSACRTCQAAGQVPRAAIFHAFRPTAVEYIVKGSESPAELDRLEKRGLTLVKVERAADAPLFPD